MAKLIKIKNTDKNQMSLKDVKLCKTKDNKKAQNHKSRKELNLGYQLNLEWLSVKIKQNINQTLWHFHH